MSDSNCAWVIKIGDKYLESARAYSWGIEIVCDGRHLAQRFDGENAAEEVLQSVRVWHPEAWVVKLRTLAVKR